MKKTIYSYWSHLVVMLVAIFALSSCGTEDDPSAAPTITVNPETATLEVGQSVTFTYTVVSNNDLQEFSVIVNSVPDESARVTDFSNKNSYSGNYVFTPTAAGTVTLSFNARDKEGLSSTKTVEVTVNAATEPIAVRTFRAVLMGAQDNSNPSFIDVDIDAATPQLFTYSNQQAKNNASVIDFGYLVGSTSNGQGSVIGSPKDVSIASIYNNSTNGVQAWSVRNDTRFKDTSISETEFEALNEGSQIIAIYANGTKPNNTGNEGLESESTRVNQLSAGKTFAFKTAAGNTGIAYVESVTGGDTGTISLKIKVAQQ